MADFLGSLLDAMDKPPSLSSKITSREKKEAELMHKIEEVEKKKLCQFRKDIEDRVDKFMSDASLQSEKFETMDKIHRTIVHDVADVAGIPAYSFGIENIDRHIVIYKPDAVPSEDELAALRRGEVYNPEQEKIKQILLLKEEAELAKKTKIAPPTSDYHNKYEHLIGKDSGKDAAIAAKPKLQFGIVPSELKRDQRSIEETLNDIRKKKQKVLKDTTKSESPKAGPT